MERLWSYLRRFGRMTKEMRIDVLSSALIYYGIKTKERLGSKASCVLRIAGYNVL